MVLQLGHREALESLAFSPDGRTLASVAFDGLKIWDVASGDLRLTIPSPETPLSVPGGVLTFRQDSRKLLYAGKVDYNTPAFHGQHAYEYDSRTGRLLRTLDATMLSRDGRALLSRRSDGDVHVTDARTGRFLGNLPAKAVTAPLDFSQDGALAVEDQDELAPAGPDGRMRLWDVRRGRLSSILSDDSGAFGPAAFSPDGKTVVTSGEDPRWKAPTGPGPFTGASYAHLLALKVWNARTGHQLHVWRGHEEPSHLTFLPDGRRLLVDRQVLDSRTGRLIKSVEYLKKFPYFPVPQIISPYSPFAVAPGGHLLASSDGGERGIQLWDLNTGGFRGSLAGAATSSKLLQFSPDGRRLVTAGGPPCLWDMKTGRFLRQLAGMGNVTNVTFLPNGLVGAGNLQEATIWDAASGKVVTIPQSVPPDSSPIGYHDGVAVSPQGDVFVTFGVAPVGQPQPLEVWSVTTHQLLRPLPDFQGTYLESAIFTPNGTGIANGGTTGVTLWNLQTGAVLRTFDAKGAELLAFSANGAVMATENSVVQLWNVNTGTLIASLNASCRRAALSSSGDEFFASSEDRLQQYPVSVQNSSPEATWTLPLSNEFDHALAVSPNGHILAVGDAGAVKLFGTNSHKLLLTLVMFPSSDDGAPSNWIAYTPDDHYDASPGADRFIRWRSGGSFFPNVAYEKQFHRPDLIQKALTETP